MLFSFYSKNSYNQSRADPAFYNPLAIISGNAQLLLELAGLMDLDEELVKPIRDIEEASLRIAESLGKLNSIQDLIARESKGEENHLIGLTDW